MNRAAIIGTGVLVTASAATAMILGTGVALDSPVGQVETIPVATVYETDRGPFTDEHPVWAVALSTPCETEDSTDCYWNAATMGNGLGDSFVSIGDATFYLD